MAKVTADLNPLTVAEVVVAAPANPHLRPSRCLRSRALRGRRPSATSYGASVGTSSIAFVLEYQVWSNTKVHARAADVSASTVELVAAPPVLQVTK